MLVLEPEQYSIERSASRTETPDRLRAIIRAWMVTPEERTDALRYSFMLGVTAVAFALTLALWPVTQYAPLVLIFAAVLASAWYGGLAPGLLCTLIVTAVGFPWLLRSSDGSALTALSGLLQGGLFVVASTVASLRFGLSASVRRKAALEEARLRQAEEQIRRLMRTVESSASDLDAARRRFQFIDATTELTTTSLDQASVLNGLAQQAVSGLCSLCIIDLAEDDGQIRRAVAVSRDPEHAEQAQRLRGLSPDRQSEHPVVRALFSRQPLIARTASEVRDLLQAARPEEAALFEELGVNSCVCVPLIAREHLFGVMTLAWMGAHSLYAPADLPTARDIAHRAALGLDNARLYEASREEIRQRRLAQDELARRQQEVEDLNARLQRAMIETHHRVKNNLQIIAGMIEMRLLEAGETVPREELARLESYVLTLAGVHDILTHRSKAAGEAATVSVREVLEKLLTLMRQTSGGRTILYSLEDAVISARKGTSLALLTNELVSNALKHGRSQVHVRFTAAGETGFLEVEDDGPGFPPGFDPMAAANTGLELVESLSRTDLGGEAAYRTRPEGGGSVRVRISLSS